MLHHIQIQLRSFLKPPIGKRFQEFNRRHRDSGFASMWWGRLLFWFSGAVLIVIGLFFAVVPGPALIFVVPGAAMFACESLWVARGMDFIDLKTRPLIEWVQRRWRALSKGTKVAARVVAVVGSLAAFTVGVFLMR